MSLPRIPAGLTPLVAGYSFGAPGGALATQVAGGMARYGLDYDQGAQRHNVALIMSSLQFAVWTAFFLQVVKQGTIAFEMPLDSGFGTSFHTVNIVPGTYNVARLNSKGASVSFTVETESQAYLLDEGSAMLLIDLYGVYGENISALLARLAQFANIDTNVLNS